MRTSAFLNYIVNIDFVCGLMFLKNIMPQAKTLSDYLQRKSVNVASALVVLNSTQDCLKRMRSEDKNFNNEIEAAISVAKYLGTDPIADFARLHKNRRRPEAENFELQQISTFYRTEFFKFIDSLSATLAEKEKCLRGTFEPFLKVLPGTVEEMRSLLSMFPTVFSRESSTTLHSELAVFFEHAKRVHEEEQQRDLENGKELGELSCNVAAKIAFHSEQRYGIFKLAARLSRLFITAAPSVATNERSFSLMKRVKSYSRNKTGEAKLNDNIKLDKIVKKWSLLKTRRESIN